MRLHCRQAATLRFCLVMCNGHIWRRVADAQHLPLRPYRETTRRLQLFFPDLTLPISRVTSERAKWYYEAFRQRRKKNGEPISVRYHRCTLINARSFLSWSLE
jgi:hypothetical protein